MAMTRTATVTQPPCHTTTTPQKPRRACFSFAAYAKNLIDHLKNSDVPVARGLTDSEFSTIESTFSFAFPPDLRSILQEGLPVGPGFPDWRSFSAQELQLLLNLPVLGVSRQVSLRRFWHQSWGPRPENDEQAVKIANSFLEKAPVLVPIFRFCYIPAFPCLAGNPVFRVSDEVFELWSFDVAGFFQQVEFRGKEAVLAKPSLSNLFNAPPWTATEARRIEFWSDVVDVEGKTVNEVAHEDTRGWWSGELGGCLEEVCCRLRNGGWKEEDVREMMMMDGSDQTVDHDSNSKKKKKKRASQSNRVRDKEGVEWHVRVLSLRLLRAGWSTEDVVESLGEGPDGGVLG